MEQRKHTAAILGGGSFGTATASILAENGHRTRLWVRDLRHEPPLDEVRMRRLHDLRQPGDRGRRAIRKPPPPLTRTGRTPVICPARLCPRGFTPPSISTRCSTAPI